MNSSDLMKCLLRLWLCLIEDLSLINFNGGILIEFGGQYYGLEDISLVFEMN